MNDEKRRILNMLAEGKINVTEAEELLVAIGEKNADPSVKDSPIEDKCRPKCLRIMVEDDSKGEAGEKVNIKIPLQLIRAGMKLGSIIPGKTREKIDAALKDKGIEIDINDVKPEQLEQIFSAMKDCCIDVDSQKGKVKICCE
jgi:hypothetical protein